MSYQPWGRMGAQQQALVGAGLMMVSGVAINVLGSVVPLQRATTPEIFGQRAVEVGGNVRWSGLIDIVGFVPGYVLFGLAVFAALGSRLGPVVLAGAAVADQVENVIVQLALWGFDGTTPPTPGSTTIALLRVANTAKWLLLAAVLVVTVVALVGWVRRR